MALRSPTSASLPAQVHLSLRLLLIFVASIGGLIAVNAQAQVTPSAYRKVQSF
jgi:hypothetical protein